MFLFLYFTGLSFILGYVPEPFELLFFGVGLILLTIGLRWILKRGETNVEGEIEKSK